MQDVRCINKIQILKFKIKLFPPVEGEVTGAAATGKAEMRRYRVKFSSKFYNPERKRGKRGNSQEYLNHCR